jgi:glycine/D-amino acid oxidase-like deaminating enzyme
MLKHDEAPDARGIALWDAGAQCRFPRVDQDITVDVAVVGLGGSGLACVRELQRHGVRVAGIDAGRVGWGAAGRNGGFLLAGLSLFYHDAAARFGRERARAIYQLTLDELDLMERDLPQLLSRPGSLRIAESDEERDDCERQLTAMRADELPVERYDGSEGSGLLIPGDGTFHPLSRCHVLAEDAAREGALLFEQSPVTHIDADGVHTAQGVARARQVIVAVDGCLERLLPELAPRVRTARLQMLATAPTHDIRVPRPVYARWGFDYWQQRPDGAIALGGARDVGGDSEWTTDATPTAPVQAALEHRLRERLGVQAPITHRWAATVGYTHDGMPVVSEPRPGVWAIGGYSGTGNVIGALLGRGMARWLVSGDDAIVRPFLDAQSR